VLIRGPLARLVTVLMRRRLEALFAASVEHVARLAEQAGNPRKTAPIEQKPA
jgi:hypothetical protein